MRKAIFWDCWWTIIKPAFSSLNELTNIRIKMLQDLTGLSKFHIIKGLDFLFTKINIKDRDYSVIERDGILSNYFGVPADGSLGSVFAESMLKVPVVPVCGIYNLLIALKNKGKKLGIISNTPFGNVERFWLKKLNLLQYFDTLIFSIEVGKRKPHKKIFNVAMESIGVHPNESIHIGDSPETDILGAKSAGMMAIYLNTRKIEFPKNLPEPDCSEDSIEKLKKILVKL